MSQQQLTYFDPIHLNSIQTSEYQSIVDYINELHKKRYNCTISDIKIADEYKTILENKIKNLDENQDKNNEINKIHMYLNEFTSLLHKIYDQDDKHIYGFLIYYLKTPYLTLDDPFFEQTKRCMPGLSSYFLDLFLSLFPYERCSFMKICYEEGIDFNQLFLKAYTDESTFSIQNILINFINSLKRKQEPLTLEQAETYVKSDFSRYYEPQNKHKSIDNLKNVIQELTKETVKECEQSSYDIYEEMIHGKYDELVNVRCNQYIILYKLHSEDKINEICESIEENILNKIHGIISTQMSNIEYSYSKGTPSLTNQRVARNENKKKIITHNKYTDTNLPILFEDCSLNMCTQFLSYYKKYKKDIYKLVQTHAELFNSKKQYTNIDLYTILYPSILEHKLSNDVLYCIQLFAEMHDGSLLKFPSKNILKKQVYTSLYSNLINDIPMEESSSEKVFELVPIQQQLFKKVKNAFSKIHMCIKQEYPDYEHIEEQLKLCECNDQFIRKCLDLLNIGQHYSFEGLFNHHVYNLLQLSNYQTQDHTTYKNNSINFWILLRPYLNIPTYYRYYIRSNSNIIEKEVIELFGKEIKKSNKYIPSVVFFNTPYEDIINSELIKIGIYDPKKIEQTSRDLTNEEYSKCKEYMKQTNTKHTNLIKNIYDQSFYTLDLVKCKHYISCILDEFYKQKLCKRNSILDSEKIIQAVLQQYECYKQDCTIGNISKKIISLILPLDPTTEFYHLCTSYHSLWLQSNHSDYSNLIKYNMSQIIPEYMFCTNVKNALEMIYEILDKRCDSFINYSLQNTTNTTLKNIEQNQQTGKYIFSKHVEPNHTTGYYFLFDNGSSTFYTKDQINSIMKGEEKLNIPYELNEFLESIQSINKDDCISELVELEWKCNKIINEQYKELLPLILDILSYSKQFITLEKCNQIDQTKLITLLQDYKNTDYINIAIDYICKSVLQIFRKECYDIIHNYFYSNQKYIQQYKNNCKDMCIQFDYKTDLIEYNLHHCKPIFLPICNKIQSYYKHTLPITIKQRIINYLKDIILFPIIDEHYISNPTINNCSVCKNNISIENGSLKTISMCKENNLFIDKQQTFCEIECMDIHMASSSTLNESEIKQVEVRSALRELIMLCFKDFLTLQTTSYILFFIKFIECCKLNDIIENQSKDKYKDIQSICMSYKNMEQCNKMYSLCLEQINPTTTSYISLLKQVCLCKDQFNRYLLPSLFLHPNSDNLFYSIIHSIDDIPKYYSCIEKCISYFQPSINISQLNPETIDKTILLKCFENPIFVEMYLNVIQELTTQQNNDFENNKENIFSTDYISCNNISIQTVQKWLQTHIESSSITNYEKDIIEPFYTKFKCYIPLKDELQYYYKLQYANLLVQYISIFIQEGNTNLEEYLHWLPGYISSNLKLAMNYRFKDSEKQNDSIQKIMNDYKSKEEFTFLNEMLKSCSTVYNENCNEKDCMKYFIKSSSKENNYQSIHNTILHYFKCDWDELLNQMNDGFLFYNKFLFYYLQLISTTQITPKDLDIGKKYKRTKTKLEQYHSKKSKDKTIDDPILIENADIILDTIINNNTDTENEEDDIESIATDFIAQFEKEKQINPKIKQIFEECINIKNDEDFINIIETIVPDSSEINDTLIKNLYDECINFKYNGKQNKEQIYQYINILVNS